jgi:predicted GNAT family N-acyltransferase
MGFVIKVYNYGSPEYEESVKLRYKILRVPLGLEFTAEELKKDEHDIHFGLFDADKIVACLILSPAGASKIKMRQVAVDTAYHGQGLGKKLSQAAEDYARRQGFKLIYCNARKTAAPFYQSMSYQIASNEFTEVGIPHYMMEKKLE